MLTPLPASRYLLLLTYALLSAVAFFPMLQGLALPFAGHVLLMEILMWLLVWAIFGHPRYFHPLLLPVFLVLPVEIYLRLYYFQGISSHHFGILFESSPAESLEFLGEKRWLLLAIVLGTLAWFGLTWRIAHRSHDLALGQKARVAVLLLACGLLVYRSFGSDAATKPPASQKPSLSVESGLAPDSFARSWPFGIVAHLIDFWGDRQYLLSLREQNRHFRFGATQQPPAHLAEVPQVFVLVIGESARRDRWSLFGYARQTTPLLQQIPNLLPLPDLISPVTATRLSVPVMLTRKTAKQSLFDDSPEKSFISAFKEAGFKTFWLSNQQAIGQFDTPISVFAQEADVLRYMNLGNYAQHSALDDVLLAPVQAALQDKHPKKLIVLHTLGNHWNYSRRHPGAFDKWQPSLFGKPEPDYTDSKLKLPIDNSYDNATLYTDWVLAQVIAQLQASAQAAALLYLSDHGESLHDDGCDFALHGVNSKYNFQVPAFVWYSPQYAQQYPAKLEQLQRHRQARLSSENVFHTMLDLADIRYRDQRLEWSVAHPAFVEHPRLVDSFGWANYDNAFFHGACQVVVERGSRMDKALQKAAARKP